MSRLAIALCLAALPLGARAGPAASAELRDVAGRVVGTASFEPAAEGVAVEVQVTGLRPGAHGFHVHDVGTCTPPDFKAAGGHFNPTGRKHGLTNPAGHHGGDLPNLVVGADGAGKATALLRGVTLDGAAASLFHPGGTSVVVHADADDGMTDPAGNSGARIACGVVVRR